MNAIRTALFGGIIVLAIAPNSWAQASDREIADAWMTAYTSQDFAAMRAMLTEDSRFIDPSSFGRDGFSQEINWTGPDAILSGIQEWGVSHAQYSFEDIYASPGRVVYRGSIDVTFGRPNPQLRYKFPIITIISVDNGFVSEHRDYTDYDGAMVPTRED